MIPPVEDKIRIKTGERWSGMAEKSRQKRIVMKVWSLVLSEKWISNGKWWFHTWIWRSWRSKNGCLMILSHCRWTAMAVMNIAFRWQWTLMAVMNIALRWRWILMAVMTLYKRTSELQRWRTTPAVMNSTDEPASFNSSELLRQWRTP